MEGLKALPFFKTARKDHAIARLLDVITHETGEAKWLGEYLEISIKRI